MTGNLLLDPFVLPWQHDPRFAALCKQAGVPLPGQRLPGQRLPGQRLPGQRLPGQRLPGGGVPASATSQ